MFQATLQDTAVAAAKGQSHPEVERRHVLFAVAKLFRDREEVAPLWAAARSALEPAGQATQVPTISGEASALLDSLRSENDAIRALLQEHGPGPAADRGSASSAVQEMDEHASPRPASADAEAKEPRSEGVEDVLADLDRLVGLGTVKAQLRRVASVVEANQVRSDAGLPTVNPSLHLVFTGAPGTGKTTVARLVARLYSAAGALPGARFVEAGRADLVAGYVGQTAIKTAEVIRQARPGVLFIDEAYALAPSHASDFGAEAIATLVKAMEDHRDDLAVIIAGYADETAALIASNPGLKSRFKTFIEFPEYTPNELVRIFQGFAEEARIQAGSTVLERAREVFVRSGGRAGFGNARHARSLFEEAYARMSARAAADGEVALAELTELIPEDIGWEDGAGSRPGPRIGFGER